MAQIRNLKDTATDATIYPVTTPQAVYGLDTLLTQKVDKIPGKGLSTNDYDNASKTKLDNCVTTDDLKTELNKKADVGTVENIDLRLQSAENDLALVMDSALSGFGVGAWNPEILAPEMIEFKGDKSFLADWHWWLIDTTDNEGIVTHPVGELNPVNLLRFKNGKFAPTVGITEEMRAECDVALYLDAEATQLYSEAGAFDAEAFYNEHGMTKLYDADGNEVRVLRPWETTETKYTIGVSHRQTIYLLDNIIGKSGKSWRGLFSKPVVWDGIDVSNYPLAPTAISPCPVTTIDNKARCFFYLYEGEANCKSGKGQGNLCTIFDNGRTYPRSNMHQVSNMQMARANNADVNAPYPCAEGGYHAYNTYITAMEVLHGTKALHAADKFGSGISSNDACNNEATWLANGGVRFKVDSADEWTYNAFCDTPSIAYMAAEDKIFWHALLNSEYPKEQCMESQMAYSFAVETDVAENEEFEFYGAKYRFVRVPGSDENKMNVRVYKVMAGGFPVFDLEGNAIKVSVEVNLRMSLVGGVKLGGDIFACWSGGYEQVGYCDHDPAVDSMNFPIDIYIQPDQAKWANVATVDQSDWNEAFGFENRYILAYQGKTLGNGYAKNRLPYTNFNSIIGGGSLLGECFYRWGDNYFGRVIGHKYRICSLFSGHASNRTCSPRSALCYASILNSYHFYSGSAQYLVDTTMAQGVLNK